MLKKLKLSTKAKKMFFLNSLSAHYKVCPHTIKQSSSSGVSGFSAKLACIVTFFFAQCTFGVEAEKYDGYNNGYKTNSFLKNHDPESNCERRICPSDEDRKYVQDKIKKKENWHLSRQSLDGKKWDFIFVTNLTDQKDQNLKCIKQKIDTMFSDNSTDDAIIFLVDPQCLYDDLANDKVVFNTSPITEGNMHQNEYPKDSATADCINIILSGISEATNSEKKNKSVSIAFLATIEYMRKIESISGVNLDALPLHKFLPEDGIRILFNTKNNNDSLPAGVILLYPDQSDHGPARKKRDRKLKEKTDIALQGQANAYTKPVVDKKEPNMNVKERDEVVVCGEGIAL